MYCFSSLIDLLIIQIVQLYMLYIRAIGININAVLSVSVFVHRVWKH